MVGQRKGMILSFCKTALCALFGVSSLFAAPSLLEAIKAPILFRGDSHTAYRDPLLIFENGKFHMFYSYVLEEEDNLIYWYTALSTSTDLQNWTPPRRITPKDQNLNYASPGNVVRVGGEWLLCLQTYPIVNFRRGDKLRFADNRARLFIMRSPDLENWGEPELIRVKGPDVSEKDIGKMIDSFLLRDKDTPGKWWCFYKQNGRVHCSWSMDLRNWTPGAMDLANGENPCVIVKDGEYILYYSPKNGVGVKRSRDLKNWREEGVPLTFGQADWPWAETRLTAGYVEDLRTVPGVGKYVMVYHASGPGKVRTELQENANAHIGIAWSDDLKSWDWPGKKRAAPKTAAKPRPGPDVLVVSDAKDEDTAFFPPTPDTPVYYYFVGQKERALGRSYAGEKYPRKDAIEREVVRALASQNYVRTQVGGPKPSLVIMVMWGSASVISDDIPGDPESGGGGGVVVYNQREMRQLVGAHKAAARHDTDPLETSQSSEAMRDDRVYIMLGAFDADALARKERKIVWRTSMSIDTLVNSFPASLNTMLASAAPYFGRNTDAPILVDDKVRHARVELGEMTVVDDNVGTQNPPPAKPKGK